MAAIRNSNVEVLRIVAMIAIVAHHYAIHGGVMYHTNSWNTDVFLLVFSGYGKFGVDLFVLVGSYFMVTASTRGKALASIYSQVLPLSWLILLAVVITGVVAPTGEEVRNALAPILFGQWWFVTVYVLLVLIAPYLSLVATQLSRIQLRRLIIAGAIMWSGLTIIDGIRLELTDLVWFVFLFFVAAYVRLHGVPGTARTWMLIALGLLALLAVALYAVAVVRHTNGAGASALGWPRHHLAAQQSILPFAAAVAALVWAVKAPASTSRLVNYWAAAAFGVYLIHDNSLFRRYLWPELVDTSAAAGQWWLPLHALASVLAVYVACSVIIFTLQPIILRPALRATTAIRRRIEARLEPPTAASDRS